MSAENIVSVLKKKFTMRVDLDRKIVEHVSLPESFDMVDDLGDDTEDVSEALEAKKQKTE